MDISNPYHAGVRAFMDGESKSRNPYSYKEKRHDSAEWNRGWQEKADGVECQGVEIELEIFSCCNGAFGDCPVCGL